MKTILKVFGVMLIGVGLTSCNKEMEPTFEVYGDVASSEIDERDFEEEDELGVHECSYDGLADKISEEVIVTDSMEAYPKTIILDYGEGIEDARGKIKSGIIEIVITGDLSEEGSSKTMTFIDFKIDGNPVAGYRSVENAGVNESGNQLFRVHGEIERSRDEKTIIRSFDRTREWVNGFGTCEREDDEFLVSGSSTVTIDSRTISRTITIPLRINKSACEFISEGEIKVVRPTGETALINFGDGTCDTKATLTKEDGDVKEIDLESRRVK